jgi:hypothetical protein
VVDAGALASGAFAGGELLELRFQRALRQGALGHRDHPPLGRYKGRRRHASDAERVQQVAGGDAERPAQPVAGGGRFVLGAVAQQTDRDKAGVAGVA